MFVGASPTFVVRLDDDGPGPLTAWHGFKQYATTDGYRRRRARIPNAAGPV